MNNNDGLSSSTGSPHNGNLWRNIMRWFDSESGQDDDMHSTEFNWLRVMPFIILHLLCLLAFFSSVKQYGISSVFCALLVKTVCYHSLLPPLFFSPGL